MGLKVCIDAGHGGKDPGALLDKRYEKDDTLKIALRLGKVLKANNVDVAYTRTTDVYASPTTKALKGNQTGADLFVCIHRNASAKKDAKGTEVFVYNTKGTKYEIAKKICKSYFNLGFVNRGVKKRTDLAVLNKTNMQALLVEVGFITNKEDNELLDSKFYSIVNVIAREICKAYKMEFRTITQLKD